MTPTSDSLVTLIEQALQTNDDIILEQCLSQMDNNIIEETTKRLPYNKIIILISKLIIKFEKKPTRGILLTRWLTCILRIHATYLLTVPDLNKKLAGLVYMLENRISTYTNLVSLAGRLDILMSSSSAAKSVNNSHTKLLSNVSHDHEIDIYQS
jgi:U3 small nucleolar RNA-associated protein 5